MQMHEINPAREFKILQLYIKYYTTSPFLALHLTLPKGVKSLEDWPLESNFGVSLH